MKVKEVAKEAKQKRAKERKFPYLVYTSDNNHNTIVMALNSQEGVVLVADDYYYSVGEYIEEQFDDAINWLKYEGELRLYN